MTQQGGVTEAELSSRTRAGRLAGVSRPAGQMLLEELEPAQRQDDLDVDLHLMAARPLGRVSVSRGHVIVTEEDMD